MNLSEAMKIGAWSPLRSVAAEAREVLPYVFELQRGLYLGAQPYNKQFERGLPDAPFVTRLYWASSFSALQRQSLGDASIPVQLEDTLPSELSLGTDGTYGALRSALKGAGSFMETATYNNKGLFLFKHLSGSGLEYFFTSPEVTVAQSSCLVSVRLGRAA